MHSGWNPRGSQGWSEEMLLDDEIITKIVLYKEHS